MVSLPSKDMLSAVSDCASLEKAERRGASGFLHKSIIAEDDQDIVFQEFIQIDNSERDNTEGLGLGLANANGLAKVLQAPLTATSKVGHGPVFSLSIPISSDVVVEDICEDDLSALFTGKNILLIDDDQAIRIGLQRLLKSWECNCMVAESAEDALLHFADAHIDLVIVDYRLRNNVSGKQVIAQMKQHFSTDLPTIIVTGDTAGDRILEAREIDAVLLHKPASSSQLHKAKSKVLS